MSSFPSRILPLSLACAALLMLAGCQRASAPAASSPAVAAEPAGAPSPPAAPAAPADGPIALKLTATDGSTLDLAAHRGRWVVVNFWATWCAPCRKEMPELSALHAMRSNIEVVGLAYEDIEVPEMQSFLTKHPVTYPIVIVDPFDPPADFATPRGLPLTHLLDPQGKLAHTFLGPVTAADIEKQIAAGK